MSNLREDRKQDILAHCMKMRPKEYADKYREMEKQLKNYCESYTAAFETCKELHKQLAESVPKIDFNSDEYYQVFDRASRYASRSKSAGASWNASFVELLDLAGYELVSIEDGEFVGKDGPHVSPLPHPDEEPYIHPSVMAPKGWVNPHRLKHLDKSQPLQEKAKQ